MARAATDRAALAARFSSAPEHERAPATGPGQIRYVTFTVKLPAGRHHVFAERLRDVAFRLGVAPKWVGLQAGLEEAVALIETNETVARLWEERLRERVQDNRWDPTRAREQ